MFEVPAQGLQDGATPLRVLTPPDAGAQPETLVMLRQEQQAAAAERARCYSDALADQLRARRTLLPKSRNGGCASSDLRTGWVPSGS
ncbi:MAG: hypothetical protein IPK78_16405 [Rhodospirillales bacterium]|nr:hypothetical protein [Rhodospirillales bacterium]